MFSIVKKRRNWWNPVTSRCWRRSLQGSNENGREGVNKPNLTKIGVFVQSAEQNIVKFEMPWWHAKRNGIWIESVRVTTAKNRSWMHRDFHLAHLIPTPTIQLWFCRSKIFTYIVVLASHEIKPLKYGNIMLCFATSMKCFHLPKINLTS